MTPSVVKSAWIAAVFLVSSTTAQIGNWNIVYQSISTNFANDVADEITLDYLIGTGRGSDPGSYAVELFEKDCVNAINIPVTKGESVTSFDADFDQLTISIDLAKTDISSSNIWNDGSDNASDPSKMEFCTRVTLLSGAEIIKEE